ncbi:type II toxin-antitoxin system PemK/MazF family toxin [Bilophila sp.]|uniref:type II toxin-antitoxin system PemK/MazF family toxin n=1 Tax=Bilophila sp. TaxID=1929485 RepID=UPI0030770A53
MSVQKGELIWVDFDPTRGHEQQKRRPAIVVSATTFNDRMGGIVWVLPITSKKKGRPDEIALPEGLPVRGVLLLSQLRALDIAARGFERIGMVPDEFMDDEVSGRLIAVLEG